VSARLRLTAAVASVALGLSSAAPSCRRVPPPARDALQDAFLEDGLSAVEASGHRVFVQRCATCHGARGRGDGQNAYNLDPPPPDFQESLGKLTASERRKVVEQGTASVGRSPQCPPWGRSLSADELDAVVAWLGVASRPDAPAPASGSAPGRRRAVADK
jgi:mono/diheme cytochrome c family protein